MAFEPDYLGADFMLGVDGSVPLQTNWFQLDIFDYAGNPPLKLITHSTQEISEFAVNYDTLEVHYGNSSVKFPGKAKYDDVNVTLACFCDPNVLAEVETWHSCIQEHTSEARGVPSQYHRTVYISRHDGTKDALNGTGGVKSVMQLIGTFPTKIGYGDYNQEGGSIVKLNLTLAVSRYKFLDKTAFSQGGSPGQNRTPAPRAVNI